MVRPMMSPALPSIPAAVRALSDAQQAVPKAVAEGRQRRRFSTANMTNEDNENHQCLFILLVHCVETFRALGIQIHVVKWAAQT